MILELSGHLNYNYHCDNVLWLWSVLLEDQNKISSKPGVLGFMSTRLSLRIPREKQQQQPEGAIPALYFTHTTSRPRVYAGSRPHLHPLKGLSEWQSLYFNITVTTDSLVTSGWSVCCPVHTPPSLALPRTANYNMTALLSFKIMSHSDLDSVVFSLLCAF